MEKARIEAVRTQSPIYKWISLKLGHKNTQKPRLYKSGTKHRIPGAVIDAHLWAYGTVTLPIASSYDENGHYELLVSNATIPENALQQSAEGEEIEISAPKGKGFPLKQLSGHDIVLITDNTGLGAMLSFIPYLNKHRKQCNNITMVYAVLEQAEIIMKEKLREIQKEFPLITKAGPIVEKLSERIEYNPFKTKALIAVSANTKNDVLDFYVKPLGISYKDVYAWNMGNASALM